MDKDGDKKGGDKKGGQSGAGLGGAAGVPDPASLLDAASLFGKFGKSSNRSCIVILAGANNVLPRILYIGKQTKIQFYLILFIKALWSSYRLFTICAR